MLLHHLHHHSLSPALSLPLSLNNSESLAESQSITPTSTAPAASRKRKNTKDLDTLLIQSIKKDLEAPSRIPVVPAPEKDPETLFCLSLVQELKELDPFKKRKAKLKIMEIFCELNDSE